MIFVYNVAHTLWKQYPADTIVTVSERNNLVLTSPGMNGKRLAMYAAGSWGLVEYK